ncbi:hypothetical protein PCC8801_4278 [Rippkaea orientalis PCC 8801]|uniref:Uncharacterized protein n=1 Tax=Rippkaea orientalis (strain PCC 8801 / RF-1) TaxID=41431 RepID=B7JV68_RIPO1|nr:hypothetical protein [Rippkaea orientalis]ACK68201.1 hypothetical protein PCC8801_4278 [Rippkaea orientalis PCC 8801]
MLVLNSDQVKYCQVVSTNSDIPQVLEAIYYQEKFFIKGKSFSLNTDSKAFKKMYNTLEIKQKIAVFVKYSSQLTVYYFNPNVTWIPSINLDNYDKEECNQPQLSWVLKLRQKFSKEISLFKSNNQNPVNCVCRNQDWVVVSTSHSSNKH